MSSCPFEHDAGPYVLGALSPDERVAFERHLADCDDCTREVREFAGLPGLLSRIPAETLEPEAVPPPVPDTLLPAVVRRIRRSQRRRALATGGLVAAAAAVALGSVGVALAGGDDDDQRADAPVAGVTASPEALVPVGTPSVSGWVSMTPVGWGTRLDLTCEYRNPSVGEPYRDDAVPRYTMVVTTREGATEQVASWKGLPGKQLHLAAATSVARDDIANVVIKSADGRDVLELTG